jgi:hypothetical protein
VKSRPHGSFLKAPVKPGACVQKLPWGRHEYKGGVMGVSESSHEPWAFFQSTSCLLGTKHWYHIIGSIFSLFSRWSIDDTSSEAESWLQDVEDTQNLVAELDLVLVVTLRQVLYLQHVKYYFTNFLQGFTYLQKKRPG